MNQPENYNRRGRRNRFIALSGYNWARSIKLKRKIKFNYSESVRGTDIRRVFEKKGGFKKAGSKSLLNLIFTLKIKLSAFCSDFILSDGFGIPSAKARID